MRGKGLTCVWPGSLLLGRKATTKPRQHIEKQRHQFASKVCAVKAAVFLGLTHGCESWDYKEGWAPKNCCFQIVELEKTLESLLDCKDIKPVNPRGNQSWVLTGRTDTDTEALIRLPPDVKRQLTGKDPDAGEDWRQEEKRATEDEMAEWHHWLNGREFEQAPRVGGGQGSLACCSPWGCRELDISEWLNELNWTWCLQLLLFAQHCFGYLVPLVVSYKFYNYLLYFCEKC